ncbi:MAG: NAD-dependent epimerase/dehydratase family protein [Bdellovibrionales bacterium]
MKVVVTGANGFLGSWLVKKLNELGQDVHILNRQNSDLSELKNLKFSQHVGDVLNPESLKKAFEGAELIYHLAGVVAYRKSERQNMERVNVEGTRNVITALRQNKVPRLLHLSSVVTVGAGHNPNEILNENSVYNLKSYNLGYFETKRAAENLVMNELKSGDFEAQIVNPSTIYGAADAKKGSRKIQVKVAQGKFPFYTPGGVNVVAVEDVIDGILLALQKGKSGERYILSGENWTIQKLFTEIAHVAGVKEPAFLLPSAVLFALGLIGDSLEKIGIRGGISSENARTSTLYHWFDNQKAKTQLGFNPRPSTTAIENSVNWMREKGLLNK